MTSGTREMRQAGDFLAHHPAVLVELDGTVAVQVHRLEQAVQFHVADLQRGIACVILERERGGFESSHEKAAYLYVQRPQQNLDLLAGEVARVVHVQQGEVLLELLEVPVVEHQQQLRE
jgi:hypothetical protein